MLNKPKFLSPSTNLERCTVDMTADDIPFFCIIDGDEPIGAWQIIIYDLSDNEVVFDTSKIELASPFFPVDSKNRNVVFSVNLKDYPSEDPSSGLLLENREDPFCWSITFWGTQGGLVSSCEEVFYANKTPEVGILYSYTGEDDYTSLNNGQVLDNKRCNFKATYIQEDGVKLKRYGWKLIDSANSQVLVDTISSNQIYGLAETILLDYNGFLTGDYSIEVYVETQNNVSVITKPISFTVSYPTTSLGGDFKVQALKGESGIILDWSESVVAGGKMIDSQGAIININDLTFKTNYPIVSYKIDETTKEIIPCGTNSIRIDDGNTLVYDYGSNFNLNISEESYIVLSTQLLDGSDRTIFYIEGTDNSDSNIFRKLTYSNGKFEYIVLQEDTLKSYVYEVENTPSEDVWYILVLHPMLKLEDGTMYTNLDVTESILSGGLYPKTNLYPSDDLYPYLGTWNKLKEGST